MTERRAMTPHDPVLMAHPVATVRRRWIASPSGEDYVWTRITDDDPDSAVTAMAWVAWAVVVLLFIFAMSSLVPAPLGSVVVR